MTGEAIFEVSDIIVSPCDHPSCERWASVEIRLLGAGAWEFQRACGYHKRWAKAQLVTSQDASDAGGGEG